MEDPYKSAQKRIKADLKLLEKQRKKSSRHPITRQSVYVFIGLLLVFALLLLAERVKPVVPEVLVYISFPGVLVFLIVAGIRSELVKKKAVKYAATYVEDDAVKEIRYYLSDMPEVRQLTNGQLIALVSYIGDYLHTQNSRDIAYLDVKEFTQYINDRGIVLQENIVDLILSAENIYLFKLQTP